MHQLRINLQQCPSPQILRHIRGNRRLILAALYWRRPKDLPSALGPAFIAANLSDTARALLFLKM
jgi:hypothetical protein